jgi:hypothetical protein
MSARLLARNRAFSRSSCGNDVTAALPQRTPPIAALVTLSANAKSDVATMAMGLSVFERSALIWTSATNAVTMMTLISANSLRSSR